MTLDFDAPIERRIRALADTGTGDWPDVRRRAPGPASTGRAWRVAVAAAAAVLLLVLAAIASGLGSRVVDWLSLTESDDAIPAHVDQAHITGDRLYLPDRRPLRLAEPLWAPFLGQDAALAVPSPDGRYVAYHAAPGGRPELRVVDTITGDDRLFAAGAQSVAWDQQLAFVRDKQVLVTNGSAADAVRWTHMAHDYTVAAWAGELLLVDDPHTEVRAFTAPGRSRRLSIDNVAAVSPDGRAAVGTYLPGLYQDSPSPIVHVDDLRTGRVIASIDLTRASRGGAPARWVEAGIQAAAWRGDTIVGTSNAGSVSVLVVLRFDGRRLRLERVLRLDRAARGGARKTVFFGNPLFTGNGTRRVLVQLRGPVRGRSYFVAAVSCDLARNRCTQGRRVRQRVWTANVVNPSRPVR